MTETLYRFYDTAGALLYIGITANPPARFRAHSKEKDWWRTVTTIRVESHPDRVSVLAAERAAIVQERPRHNVMHNGTGASSVDKGGVPQLDRLAPIQPGDWVALGLADGDCPVGRVAAIDYTFISVQLKSFLSGCIGARTRVVRWTEIERIEAAYPEDAEDQNGLLLIDDEHLGQMQSAWMRSRGWDEADYGKAAIAVRAEMRER